MAITGTLLCAPSETRSDAQDARRRWLRGDAWWGAVLATPQCGRRLERRGNGGECQGNPRNAPTGSLGGSRGRQSKDTVAAVAVVFRKTADLSVSGRTGRGLSDVAGAVMMA